MTLASLILRELFQKYMPYWIDNTWRDFKYIFGYECEYAPIIYEYYDKEYTLTSELVYKYLNGHYDGSGPYEISTPPCPISDVRAVKFLNTLLLILKISYDSSVRRYPDEDSLSFHEVNIPTSTLFKILEGYRPSYRTYTYRDDDAPCGRHIHISIVTTSFSYDDFYFRVIRYVAYLTPIMAMYKDGKLYAYRYRATRFASRLYDSYVPHSREYAVLTWNGLGTLELRLNEAPVTHAWAVASILYGIALAESDSDISRYRMTYSRIKDIVYYGITVDEGFLKAYYDIINFALNILERKEILSREGVKLIETIARREIEEEKGVTWLGHATKYPEFVDREVLEYIYSKAREVSERLVEDREAIAVATS